ncbi:hypothetical protein LEM8419_03540 [Neolewinella maritima]|uniref:Uncharacterized protein n=1 Tax=Neolewinella maritima TaxID=1383882 RepID=A0ABM9B5K0_9BACT|nr:hypothetical protein [Neolewinella maritima]CAH1002668.1 hypothetical protein LEM8419_03540 [Neolewinella maritima]
MKYLLYLALLTSTPLLAQVVDVTVESPLLDTLTVTQVAEKQVVCQERGHLLVNAQVTLLDYQPTLIENDTVTLQVYQNPNTRIGTCQRCRQVVSEPLQTQPDTVILWRLE